VHGISSYPKGASTCPVDITSVRIITSGCCLSSDTAYCGCVYRAPDAELDTTFDFDPGVLLLNGEAKNGLSTTISSSLTLYRVLSTPCGLLITSRRWALSPEAWPWKLNPVKGENSSRTVFEDHEFRCPLGRTPQTPRRAALEIGALKTGRWT